MKTVAYTAQSGLCCSCGICRGICPKNCISYRREKGLFLPVIDREACIECGMCAAVCPGLGHNYEPASTAEETVSGSAIAVFNAWSRDPELRHVSASGGVVSTLIRQLLAGGLYDGAFCLDAYDYQKQLKTRLYTAKEVSECWNQSNAPKSRYLPVSHENALSYMKQNREARLVLVGTPCGLRGLKASMQALKLKRENYLLVGLFCDKVFNYNVLSYWQDRYCGGTALAALHFKNKESGGWPGDMKFFPEGGEPFYVPLADRAKAKAYFMPERCLYCVDKLNICADISLGDNYTGKDESTLGSNSVIIRTEAGLRAWEMASPDLEMRCISLRDVQDAQAIQMRLDNMYYGDLKTAQSGPDLNKGVPREKNAEDLRKDWKAGLEKLSAGAMYDADPSKLKKQSKKDNKKPNIFWRLCRRALRILKGKRAKG